MADSKLSALTEATALTDADEFYVNDSGTSKRITAVNLGPELLTRAGVTSTVAELNILDGVTSTAAEINLLDGSVAGTAVASKALVLGATKNVDTIDVATSGLKINATAVTSTATELNLLDGSVAGTAVASKALVLGGTKNIDTIDVTQNGLLMGGVAITSTPAELNVLDGYTGSVTELNYLDTLHATGVTSTEFDYLDGVTSNIQTQFSGKLSTTHASATASTSSASHVELATTAEAMAGTDTSRACTPDSLGSTLSKAASGYMKFPGGVIIQWGTCLEAASTSFPTAFPTACRAITVCRYPHGNISTAGHSVTIDSASAFTWQFGNDNSDTGYFIAIGY
jgi:hypothetical protein